MCLFTKQKTPTITDADMIVYKCVEVRIYPGDHEDFDADVFSLIQGFPYVFGKLYSTEIKKSKNDYAYNDVTVKNHYKLDDIAYKNISDISDENRLKAVRENGIEVYSDGFHFFINNDHRTAVRCYDVGKFVKCTIPAGSEIYFDETGLGITNQLIINGFCDTKK
jgi:hypothetical protein